LQKEEKGHLMDTEIHSSSSTLVRCGWSQSMLMMKYHDEEWGTPTYNDRTLFEFLCLEGAQAGLSWTTILAKRPRYREVFDGFDAARVATYDQQKVALLLADAGIVRNIAKINATIQNAQAFLRVQQEFGSFHQFIWQFVEHAPKQNTWNALAEIPASTPASNAMSKALKKRGFSFVGSTICYAFMQATGMVNDHMVSCFRHAQIVALANQPPPHQSSSS
jgi:DNA-3-methyladenine glycosylase I